eukprot:4350283-Pyramimonas_sp.AAC.1
MCSTITAEVSGSVSKAIGDNHTTLLTMFSAMQAEVAKQATAVEQQVQSALAPRLDAVSRRFQSQIDEHTAQLLAAQTRLDLHGSDIDALREQIAELRKQLAIAAAAPRDEQPPPSSFERAEDCTIVVAISQKPTTQASVVASLQPWSRAPTSPVRTTP